MRRSNHNQKKTNHQRETQAKTYRLRVVWREFGRTPGPDRQSSSKLSISGGSARVSTDSGRPAGAGCHACDCGMGRGRRRAQDGDEPRPAGRGGARRRRPRGGGGGRRRERPARRLLRPRLVVGTRGVPSGTCSGRALGPLLLRSHIARRSRHSRPFIATLRARTRFVSSLGLRRTCPLSSPARLMQHCALWPRTSTSTSPAWRRLRCLSS